MKKILNVIQWILSAVFLICLFGTGLHWSSIILLVATVLMMPIKPLREFLSGIKIKGALSVVLSIVLFFVAIIASPSGQSSSEQIKKHEEASTGISQQVQSEKTTSTTSKEISTEKTTSATSIYNDTDIEHTSKYNSNNAIAASGGTAIKNIGGNKVSSASSLPSYNGKAYSVVNNNTPTFSASDKKSKEPFERYSNLDGLGRCGVAYANICKELMPTEKRGAIGMVKPSGWQTIKYDNIDGKYLYNRCHLIGYQLAAENANEKNLITGTRYLNVQGMLPFENMVADYVKETKHHVLYRVTPVFVGNELVARGVQIEAYSVEDNGDGICFNVYCYNIQPGITINYADGSSALGTNTPTQASTTKTTTKATTKSTTKTTTKVTTKTTTKVTTKTVTQSGNNSSATVYITDSGKKYHLDGCRYLKSKHAISKSDALSQGYEPCGVCNPGW